MFAELGRVLASVPLLGHLPATLLYAGRVRSADGDAARGVRGRRALRLDRPTRARACAALPAPAFEDGKLTGEVAWVPDAPGADVLVVVCDGRPRRGRPRDGEVEAVRRYDATRSLGHVRFDGAPATEIEGADARGRVAPGAGADRRRVARRGRGRARSARSPTPRSASRSAAPIGSYQAVKHELVEILRRLENARSLMYYAGWAWQDKPDELPLAAAAFRTVAGARARPRHAGADLGARRHRRHLGARRAALLPPRAALAPPARRHGRRLGRAWPTSCSGRPSPQRDRLGSRPLALPAARAAPVPDREVHAAARAGARREGDRGARGRAGAVGVAGGGPRRRR